MKSHELNSDTIKTIVRQHYGQVATRDTGCGCAPTCCNPVDEIPATGRTPDEQSRSLGYSSEQTDAVPAGANLGLGCGNPLAIASLQPGQTVLDMGSGAGFDAFLAAKKVGPTGLVIGVDMTPEMVSKARRNQSEGDYANVQFRLGEIEHLPVADASVDVIISNCVINLSPDKDQVFREAFRVLKPGGRLAIADILATRSFPESMKNDLALYAGCVAGAALVDDVKKSLRAAGFRDVRIEPNTEGHHTIRYCVPTQDIESHVLSATIQAVKA